MGYRDSITISINYLIFSLVIEKMSQHNNNPSVTLFYFDPGVEIGIWELLGQGGFSVNIRRHNDIKK